MPVVIPALAAMVVAAAASPSPFGSWARGDGQAKVSVYTCGAAICAKNTWIRDPASSEKVGDVLVMNLKSAGAAEWTGDAYDAKRGMTYAMTMNVAQETMTTRGCLLAVICRTVSWTRIR